MGTKESTQEMTETREFDLPQDGFQLKNQDAQYSKRQRKNAACQKEELTHVRCI